jgi:lambda family phage tail tape measure protein
MATEQEMLIRLQVEAGQAIKQMETASKSVGDLTTAANNSQRPMRQLQQNVRNASYQLTDFAVQVQGGQSAMLAFSQQAPQLLAGFGAIGAAVGLIAALAPAAIQGIVALTKDSKTLEESLKGAEEAFKNLKSSFDFTDRKSLDPLIEQYKEANQETKNLILSNLELNVAIAKVASNDLKVSLRDSIEEGIKQLGHFTKKWEELKLSFSKKETPGGLKDILPSEQGADVLKGGFGVTQEQLDNIKQLQADFNAAKLSATDFFASVSKVYLATEKPTKDFTAWVQTLQKATKAQRELELATNQYEAALERLRQGNTTTVKAEEQAQKEWEKSTDKEIDTISKQFEALEKLRQQRIKEADALRAATNPLQAYEIALEKARVLLNDNIISQNEYNNALYRAQTVLANSNKLVNSFGDALSNAFAGAIIGGKSFSQVMNSLALDIQSAIIKIMIIEPLIRQLKLSMVGSGFFDFGPGSSPTPTSSGPTPGYEGLYIGGTAANGKVMSSGRMTAFANGGIVSGPTIFPMANGAGLMGEAGPEAIMPLKRGADGKLGVSGGGTVVNVYNSSGTQAEVKESTGSDGQKQIDIYIKQVMERMISTGSMDKTMQSTYGLNRVGRR